MNKIWKKLTFNWGLKIVSLILAIGLWLVVVNVEDPEMTSSFTVAVDVTNEGFLSNNNKVYEILDNTDTIRVSVTAKRSIMSQLANADLVATADLSKVNLSSGDAVQEVPIEVSARRYSGRISLSARSYALRISVDERSSASVPISTSYVGTVGEGFAIGSLKTMPSEITVSGPKTMIDAISYAEVIADVSGAVEDFDTRLTPTFYSEDGQVVDSSRLTMGVSDITVYVQVLALKNLPITYESIGTPAEGYAVDQITGALQSVIVKGRASDLAACNELVINDLDVEGLSEATKLTVSLSKYLPSGVTLYTAAADNMEVNISFKETTTATFSMLASRVSMKGLTGSQKASLELSSISFSAYGDPQVMEEVESKDFTASLDLSECTEPGSYTVDLDITCPEGVTINGSVSVTVNITGESTVKNNAAEEEEPKPADTGNDITVKKDDTVGTENDDTAANEEQKDSLEEN